MKILLIFLMLCFGAVTKLVAEPKFIMTSGVDGKNAPIDKLSSIPFDKEHEYIMFVYDDTPFGAEKVFFEISIYDDEAGSYKYSAMYTVDVKPDWSYCFKGVKFNIPMKMRIRAFSDKGDIAVKYIDVVN